MPYNEEKGKKFQALGEIIQKFKETL